MDQQLTHTIRSHSAHSSHVVWDLSLLSGIGTAAEVIHLSEIFRPLERRGPAQPSLASQGLQECEPLRGYAHSECEVRPMPALHTDIKLTFGRRPKVAGRKDDVDGNGLLRPTTIRPDRFTRRAGRGRSRPAIPLRVASARERALPFQHSRVRSPARVPQPYTR